MGSKQNYYKSYSCIWWSISQPVPILERQFSVSGKKEEAYLDYLALPCAIHCNGCRWCNPRVFSDDLYGSSLKIRPWQDQDTSNFTNVTIRMPHPVLFSISLNCSIWLVFLLGCWVEIQHISI